ncbi:hypothetical protein WNY37_11970 [Henriciella sp. AS95]|uniref:hypothetical protein n=1 Tax=Henriciella sp. AS95 TaxID=3135782 RepID=UPI003172CF23
MKHLLSLRSGAAISIAAIVSAAFTPAMASASCYSQGKSLNAQQAEAADLKTERDALLVSVEDAGDVWEEAEATRGWTPEHTATADATKAKYNSLKDELYALEAELQEKVVSLNEGVAAYNRSCATKN